MTTTARSGRTGHSAGPDLEALRAAGGGDIPVTAAPPQKKTDPTLHYSLCIGLTALGVIVVVLGVLGITGVPGLDVTYPWFLVISLFFFLPGIVGLYRGPGEPSTHVIPRPKNRKPIDPTAGAGGAAGPAPRA